MSVSAAARTPFSNAPALPEPSGRTFIPDPPATPVLDHSEKDKPGRKQNPRRAKAGVTDRHGRYEMVLLSDLHDDPKNIRKTYRHIDELAASIRLEGMIQPIVAQELEDGKLQIVSGHRRKRAALQAGLLHAPTIIRKAIKGSTRKKQLAENTHRTALDPIEEAEAMRDHMLENKISSHGRLAESLGHTQAYVSGRLALLKLQPEQQQQVRDGDLPIGQAIVRARKEAGTTQRSKNRVVVHSVHFSLEHPLAGRAQARCRAGKSADADKHYPLVGGVACGACWEKVIRIDAHRNPLDVS